MMSSKKKQQQNSLLIFFLQIGAGVLFLGLLWSFFTGSYFAVSSVVIDNSLATDRKLVTNSVLNHEIHLSGLQTLEMHEKMMSSCPVEQRLQTSRTMAFSEFVDKVFDGLEQVPVSQDPLNYVASQYSKLMEERGALGLGAWTEFGVWQGATLKHTHNLLKKTNFKGPMAGFDSFEGLPTHWRGGFVKGKFATNFEAVRANVPEEVALYQGWFQDTIGKFLDDYPNTPAGLINHDGDLFLSTAITFSLLGERIVPGTLMCFDELIGYNGYQQHEILSLFIWMKEMEATICPIAVYNLDRQRAQDNDGKEDVGQAEQSACFQVLNIPGRKSPVPTATKEGNVRAVSTK